MSNSLKLELKAFVSYQCECWEPTSSHLQEQQMLVSTDSSLQSLVFVSDSTGLDHKKIFVLNVFVPLVFLFMTCTHSKAFVEQQHEYNILHSMYDLRYRTYIIIHNEQQRSWFILSLQATPLLEELLNIINLRKSSPACQLALLDLLILSCFTTMLELGFFLFFNFPPKALFFFH